MPATLTVTTLGARLSKDGVIATLASATGIAAGDRICIGQELADVKTLTGTQARLRRGVDGTRAVAHASGAKVYRGAKADFVLSRNKRIAVANYTGDLGEMELPTGSLYFDPDTGNTYQLVDLQYAAVVGEWVVLDADCLASQLSTSAKGRVGIVVESGGASDTYAWVLRAGTFASALFTSSVTTACVLIAGTGAANISTSAGGNVIFNAQCTVAPSTATSPTVGDGLGTAYIEWPYVHGITTDIVP
jgi:hypothetical protein